MTVHPWPHRLWDLDPPTTYRMLLEAAYDLGRADGRFAAPFEGPDSAGLPSGRRLGRTPEELARQLWGSRAGTPPAGLELNAPLWYATGFSEALAEARARAVSTV
jgi:hypothetical protein